MTERKDLMGELLRCEPCGGRFPLELRDKKALCCSGCDAIIAYHGPYEALLRIERKLKPAPTYRVDDLAAELQKLRERVSQLEARLGVPGQ